MARSMCDLEVMVVGTPELDLCPLKAVVGVSRLMMACASQALDLHLGTGLLLQSGISMERVHGAS